MALRKRFPNSLRRSALTFLYSPETPPCQRIRATMQDRKLVDRDGMIERVQTRQADYLRSPTRIAWNLTPPEFSPTTSSIPGFAGSKLDV
jgi:hypothetical protein